MWLNNVLETIGNTPIIRLNKVSEGIPGTILAKVDYFNPGNSIKDRMALKMVEVAEAEGKLKPGGTIIECTSGNTGMGLALAAVVKGYKCIFTTTDKQSKEKMDILRAVGAEVIVCPTNVAPEDPASYYSVARKLAGEIPNSHFFNQYDIETKIFISEDYKDASELYFLKKMDLSSLKEIEVTDDMININKDNSFNFIEHLKNRKF
jgi:cystathionine beta-synthase